MKAFILSLVISSSLLVAEKQRAQAVQDAHATETALGIDGMQNSLTLLNQSVTMEDGQILTVQELIEMYNDINH